MHKSITILGSIGALLVSTASAENATSSSHLNLTITCHEGLKMFVSRGTGEEQGTGVTGLVTDMIASQINGSDVQPIAYPASFDDPIYFVSVANGTGLLKQAITNYAEACPDSKMALFGYSQGAQITTNTLCGQPAVWGQYSGLTRMEQIIANSLPLPQNITKTVVSAVLFGDPTYTSHAPYNHGNATGNGIFWRGDLSTCKALGNRIRSYCTVGDPFCDVSDVVNADVHGTYVEAYGEDVIQYVLRQYSNGGESKGNNTNDLDEAAFAASAESASSERLAMSAVAIAASVMAFFMV
ncbi:hypothetical protein Q7P37_009063 [Cladosporium fusiforme]